MEKLEGKPGHKIKLKKDDWVVIPDVCGPSWWAIFHNTAKAIKTDGCESCGGHAVKLISFMHDIINVDLSKKIYDPKNVLGFKKLLDKVFKQAEKQAENKPKKIKTRNTIIPELAVSVRRPTANSLNCNTTMVSLNE